MANQNILEEYLVKLSASVDTSSFNRFESTMKDVAGLMDNAALDIAKRFVEVQVGITSGFVAIGAAAIGLADKVAMSDQSYRLLALRMYTSLPVARDLSVALGAMGLTLNDLGIVLKDTELGDRFHQLVLDQEAMTQNLGPDFENQMLKIRDIRFEFTRFGVELQYLTMYVVEDLAKAFGTNIDGLLTKLRSVNDYIIQHMPEIASWIATKLKPVLIDVYNVLMGTWRLLSQIGAQLAKIDWVAVIGDIGKAVVEVTKLEQGLFHTLGAANDIRKGNFSQAYADVGGPAATAKVGGEIADLFGYLIRKLPSGSSETVAGNQAQIIATAKQYGVPPELALAVAQVESGFHQFDKNNNVLTSNVAGSHAAGIFQLQPDTAKSLGVNSSDPSGNITGGVKYLKQLLDRYGNASAALQHYYGSKSAADNQAYAAKVIQAEGDTINITINAAADPKKTADAVVSGIKQAKQNQIQRNLSEFGNNNWGYPLTP